MFFFEVCILKMTTVVNLRFRVDTKNASKADAVFLFTNYCQV